MGGKNIVDLYDDCLYYIFEYLPKEDRNSFAQVCHRFRDIVITKTGSKYSEYTINETSTRQELIEFCTCRETVKTLTIDLEHFNTSRCSTSYYCKTPVNCFGILCQTLAGMNRLEQLVIKQHRLLITPIKKPFDQILLAIRYLPELRNVQLQARDVTDCCVDRLAHLQHIESLELLVPKISSSTLVKCCKSNGNLRSLHLGYSCVQGNLGDIVSHCKNLEVLKFGMTAESSAYKPLAKLPKLKELSHFGIRRSGSFQQLLSHLAINPKMTHLSIDGGSLNLQEASQLIGIQSLRHLKCFCSTTECVEILSRLVHLEELCLWMSCSLDTSDALLKIIASCKKLKLLRLAMGKVNSNFLNDAIDLIRKENPEIKQPQ
ncbi:hypothetical protein KR009_005072, partial [Drosophila setifemur]